MRIVLIFVLISSSLATHGALASPQQDATEHHHDMTARGQQAMGFSQEKTTHHFRLFRDGGMIEVTANAPGDAAARNEIREHSQHIAKMFAAGNFDAPMFIHATTPPGVATLKQIPDKVAYHYQEIAQGAEVRITTEDSGALDAIHAFLLFQIIDHQTGDSPAISSAP